MGARASALTPWLVRLAFASCAIGMAASAATAGESGQEVLITEFMASNTSTLTDEDGDYVDWIEIQNVGLPTVDLQGWYLTDSADNLTKWQFPTVEIARGEAIIVFASDKNRAVAGRRLHTNFKLEASGEYLALVHPDGTTIAHEFAPAFPPQQNDISHGLAQTTAGLVMPGDTSRFHIPSVADAALGSDWTQPAYDDSTWSAGDIGLGFQAGTTAQFAVTVYHVNVPVWDVATAEGAVADPATHLGVTTATAPVINFHNTGPAGRYASDMPFPGTTIGNDANDFVVVVTGVVVIPTAGTWTFGVHSGDGFSLELSRFPHVYTSAFASIRSAAETLAAIDLPEPGLYEVRLIHFERNQGSSLEFFAAPGTHASFNAGVFDLVGDVAAGGLRVSAIGDELRTDIESVMRHVNATGWMRNAFEVAAPSLLDTLVLKAKYEDGFVAYLNGVEVARRNAPASLAWDSVADSDRPGTASQAPEWIDLSAFIGALTPGPNVLALHVLNDASDDGECVIIPELLAAAVTDPEAASRYFAPATPGAFNAAGFPDVSGSVAFSLADATFTENLTLTLSTAAPGAIIRFTVDGTDPSESTGAVYTDAITIESSQEVRARAFESGLAPGPIGRRLFSKLNPDVLSFASNLPLVVVDTFGRIPTEQWYTLALARIVDLTAGQAQVSDAPQFVGATGLKLRGTSSLQFPKKQYAMETWDESNDDLDVSLLGFPSESDWILYGPYTDKSLMRDFLAYRWSNSVGRYAVRTRFVEVFFDQSGGGVSASDYAGVYILQEKIKEGPDRVNITKLSSEDNELPEVSGGYILKRDRLDPGDGGFVTSRGVRLAYVHPKETEITAAQAAYLHGYIDTFETALYGPSFADPVIGYAAHIDVGSFIDHHLIVEMTRNIDGFRLSTFMFKDRGGLLHMGPVWDYNLTLGNANYLDGWLPTGWYHPLLTNSEYPWWPRLFLDPEFTTRYRDRWHELRRTTLTTATLMADIDNTAALLSEAQQRNYVRWPILGIYIWPNYYIGTTYAEEVAWMRQWLLDRLAWMDEQLGPPPVFSQQGGVIPSEFDLTISAASGTIYYTMDGSDPRLPGGGIHPSATVYAGPIVLVQDLTIRTRSLDVAVWSAINEADFDVVPPVFINEILPVNTLINIDEAGDHDPWIEIYNPSAATVDLGGYFLSDDPQIPMKWMIPPGTSLCGRSWLLIWVDGEPAEGSLHADFGLAPGGGTVLLSDPGGLVLESLAYPAMPADKSYGRFPDGDAHAAVFSTVTPLARNIAGGAYVFLNEYNAVSPSNFLSGGSSDSYWGRVVGNGGDWFELVVATDHADLRGWRLVISEDTGGSGHTLQTLTLSNDPIWSDLRAGTIITVGEDLASDVSYDPAGGDWWIHVQASAAANGQYITNEDFEVSHRNWQLTITNAAGVIQFGPAGEGVSTTGIGSDEVFKLEENPSAAVTPTSNYNDGSSSTFGAANVWSSGANTQDFAALHSVVFKPCATAADCDDANPCTTDDCVADTCAYVANTDSCDDGDLCTTNDACASGACAGETVPGCCRVDCDCDDGLFCTGAEFCIEGVCVQGGDPCANGPPCAATCDEVNDHCFDPSGAHCDDDGDACTANACDGAGQCIAEDISASCDDGDPCTDDACLPQSGCVNVPNDCVGACCDGANCSEMPAADCGAFVCDVFEHLPETFLGCLGDVDGNGVTNAGDRGAVSANIGQDAEVLVCLFDLDGNGVINAGDRGIVSANIGLCTPLPDFQNGSGLNQGSPDGRFAVRVFMGGATTCGSVSCPP
jgi:hypothetical protein